MILKQNGRIFETKSATGPVEFLVSLALFYYLNGRFLLTNGHLFVPDGEKSEEIEGEKLNLK